MKIRPQIISLTLLVVSLISCTKSPPQLQQQSLELATFSQSIQQMEKETYMCQIPPIVKVYILFPIPGLEKLKNYLGL